MHTKYKLESLVYYLDLESWNLWCGSQLKKWLRVSALEWKYLNSNPSSATSDTWPE